MPLKTLFAIEREIYVTAVFFSDSLFVSPLNILKNIPALYRPQNWWTVRIII